jgi:hypothetical protein
MDLNLKFVESIELDNEELDELQFKHYAYMHSCYHCK